MNKSQIVIHICPYLYTRKTKPHRGPGRPYILTAF